MCEVIQKKSCKWNISKMHTYMYWVHKTWNIQSNSRVNNTCTSLFSIWRSCTVRQCQKVTQTQFPLQLAVAHTTHKSQSSNVIDQICFHTLYN